jgi:hypothetical protein
MKRIVLVTENERVSAFFEPLERSRKYSFRRMSYAEWQKCSEEALCYLDVTALKQKQLEKEIQSLGERELPWGIVDPGGNIDDIAMFFHRGAGDYIDLRRELSFKVERIARVLDFFHRNRRDGDRKAFSGAPNGNKKQAPPSVSWDQVKENMEYSFCFLFVELLPSGEWKGKSGVSHQKKMQAAFHDALNRRVEDFDGKIWMWNEWTGLILFPYDGKKCDAVLPAMRLILNRVLFSIEEGDFQAVLSYKLALHIGSTLYRRRGQTGTILSDDVNFIFHLGVKKTEADSLYLSEAAYAQISKRLYPLFEERGRFEGYQTYRMVSPFPGQS